MPNRARETHCVVAVSLHKQEATEADRLTDVLKRAGWPKANRSLIIREALLLLEQALAGKDDESVFRYFIERAARRVGPSRAPQPSPRATRAEPNAIPDDRPRRDLLDVAERKT
jgi:hypothetical protein